MTELHAKFPLSAQEQVLLRRNLEFLDLINDDIQDIQLNLENTINDKIRLRLKVVLAGLGSLLFTEEGSGLEEAINGLFQKVRHQLNQLMAGNDEYIA